MDPIAQLSEALADRVAAAGQAAVCLRLGSRPRAGILWRPDVVVTSEQVVGERDSVVVAHAGQEVAATLAGRDPATNVAVFRLETPLAGVLPATAGKPRFDRIGSSPPVSSISQSMRSAFWLGSDKLWCRRWRPATSW